MSMTKTEHDLLTATTAQPATEKCAECDVLGCGPHPSAQPASVAGEVAEPAENLCVRHEAFECAKCFGDCGDSEGRGAR